MAGKFNYAQLQQTVLAHTGAPAAAVIQGASFGVDVSVMDAGNGQAIALTSDPLSYLPTLGMQESAWLSVHLMANDMATTGFAPMYAQMVLNLNDTMSDEEISEYWKHIHDYCKRINVSITGGHTGRVYNQSTTIAGGGTMMLTAPLERILTSAMAKPGDAVIITGCCAMSASAILALSFPAHVKNAIGHEQWRIACDMFYKTSSLEAALIAAQPYNGVYPVHAMHDVTEGGVFGAITEMAVASGLGVIIDDKKVPRNPVTDSVCQLYDINPRFVVGAGATIIAVDPHIADVITERLRSSGTPAVVAGLFTDDEQLQWLYNETLIEMPYHDTDPYWAAFANALKQQLT